MLSSVRKHLFGGHQSTGSASFHLASVDIGQHIRVEHLKLSVVSQIAEGGFGCIFLAEDADGKKYALKKVRIHDQDSLETTCNEVDFLRMLSGHKNIVSLLASEVRPSGRLAEVLMVLEYCPGGQVVDIMNRRLKRHFKENEVLKIFSDLCLAVAAMHTQHPPIIHRDLKPENILLSEDRGTFKLCDFGSATTTVLVPGQTCSYTAAEEEIQKMTTLPYRAPEMIDVYQQRPITSKADIWALGCVLYKLCFFDDAFGDSPLSILSAKYKIPEDHPFSDGLVDLLGKLLEPDADKRLDIIETCIRVFELRGLECPAIILQQAKRPGSSSSGSSSARESPKKPASNKQPASETGTAARTIMSTPQAPPAASKAKTGRKMSTPVANSPAQPRKKGHQRSKSNPFESPRHSNHGGKAEAGKTADTSFTAANPFGTPGGVAASVPVSPMKKGHARTPSNPFGSSSDSLNTISQGSSSHSSHSRGPQAASPFVASKESPFSSSSSSAHKPAQDPFAATPAKATPSEGENWAFNFDDSSTANSRADANPQEEDGAADVSALNNPFAELGFTPKANRQ